MSEFSDNLMLEKLLTDCLSGAVSSSSDQPIPVSLLEVIRSNRLEGLVYTASNYAVPKAWQKTYQQRQLHGLHLLKVAGQFSAELESSGVPCMALRGPVDALNLYGDVAARAYSDIDVYVPRTKVKGAWAAAQQFGFSLYHSDMPKGYYVRNHLNWALVHRDLDVMCDLHWAVDHPFQRIQIDYEGVFDRSIICKFETKKFRMPCAEDWLLLTGQHLLKHSPDLAAIVQDEQFVSTLSKRHLLKYLMDLSFFLKREGEHLDWDVVQERAALWNVEEALFCSLLAASSLAEKFIPVEVVAKAKHFVGLRPGAISAHEPSVLIRTLNRFSRNQGFSFDRLNTLLNFCWSSEKPRAPLPTRVIHLLASLTRLLLAGVDTLLCFSWVAIRKYLIGSENLQRSSKKVEVQHG